MTSTPTSQNALMINLYLSLQPSQKVNAANGRIMQILQDYAGIYDNYLTQQHALGSNVERQKALANLPSLMPEQGKEGTENQDIPLDDHSITQSAKVRSWVEGITSPWAYGLSYDLTKPLAPFRNEIIKGLEASKIIFIFVTILRVSDKTESNPSGDIEGIFDTYAYTISSSLKKSDMLDDKTLSIKIVMQTQGYMLAGDAQSIDKASKLIAELKKTGDWGDIRANPDFIAVKSG